MLEQSLITHCAPTLAGLKTAGLFCFSYTSESMLQALSLIHISEPTRP